MWFRPEYCRLQCGWGFCLTPPICCSFRNESRKVVPGPEGKGKDVLKGVSVELEGTLGVVYSNLLIFHMKKQDLNNVGSPSG